MTAFAIGVAPGAEPLDELFAGLNDAQGRTESLVVEFGYETTRTLLRTRGETTAGTFRLLRTKKGEVFASYELAFERPKGEKAERFSGLLNGGKVYWLNPDDKSAQRFEFAGGELTPFLEKYFSPFVVLLDRKRAEAKCRLEVIKQDEWYTYLSVTPKELKRDGWFPNNFQDGRVALMRKESDSVPKGMPRQLWHSDGIVEHRYDIKSWRLNPDAGAKPDEFTRPEDRPGWTVVESLFHPKK